MTNLLRVTLLCTLAALGATSPVLGQQYRLERSVGEINFSITPTSITSDSRGNLYIVSGGDLIKTTREGRIIGLLTRRDEGVIDVAFSIDGNLWLHRAGDQVRKVSLDGTLLFELGVRGVSNGQFSLLSGIAPDEQGNLWTIESPFTGLGRLQKFGPNGQFLLSSPVESASGLISPNFRIATDRQSNVWVIDQGSQIAQYSPTGTFLRTLPPISFGGETCKPDYITVDRSNNLWLIETIGHRIWKVNSLGAVLGVYGREGARDGEFQLPQGLAIDNAGNCWVADSYKHRLQRLDSEGRFLSKFGSGPINYTSNLDKQPRTPLACDGEGNLWSGKISQSFIQKFDITGKMIIQVDSGGNADGQFQGVSAMTTDLGSNVWVADAWGRIRQFSAAGQYLRSFRSRVVNIGWPNAPLGMATDRRGTLWVLDASGQAIQQFSPGGNALSQIWLARNGQIGPRGIAIVRMGFGEPKQRHAGKNRSVNDFITIADQEVGAGNSLLRHASEALI